jgi:DNA-binding MarR family transcriptional regulator
VAATELMDEIVATSQRIRAARTLGGQRPKRVDATFRLLQAIERTSYCLSIADVGRALRMSRQGAHKVVKQAAVAALVELRPNRDDRRVLQLALTARGRAELAGAAADEGAWLIVLLNGLEDRDMAIATRVLRGIRHRLARDERLIRRTPGP